MQVISLNLFGGGPLDVVHGVQVCVLVSYGVDDLYNYVENVVNGEYSSFTHTHGFPEGKEDWPVICNVRNPYSLIVSAYLDILNEYKKRGEE